ncbi:MAG: glycosyltransferase family 9 protein [Candidatus Kapaibacteriota bacterium]
MNILQSFIFGEFSKNQPLKITQSEKIFSNLNKILLLRQDRIGDVIVSIPFLKILRETLPNTEIHILLGKKNINAEIFINKFCDKIWFYDKNLRNSIKLIKALNTEKFDLIIDLFDNASKTSSLFLKMLNSKAKLGIEKENSKIYSHIVPLKPQSKVHIVDRILNLTLPFGIKTENQNIKISIDESIFGKLDVQKNISQKNNFQKRFGINISGSTEAKNWGVENYVAYINKLSQIYPEFEIMVFSTKELQEQQEHICTATKAQAAPITRSLLEFVALIRTCDFMLTPDTSVVHFCDAFSIPCVALYTVSENPPKRIPWTPYSTEYRAIITDEPLTTIPVEEVLDKTIDLINSMNY